MANLKSSLKDIRRTARRTERQGAERRRLKTLRKKAVGDSSAEDRAAYMSALDKAAKRGVVHPNKVNREKAKIAQGALHPKTR